MTSEESTEYTRHFVYPLHIWTTLQLSLALSGWLLIGWLYRRIMIICIPPILWPALGRAGIKTNLETLKGGIRPGELFTPSGLVLGGVPRASRFRISSCSQSMVLVRSLGKIPVSLGR